MEKDHGLIDFQIDRGREGKMVARPQIKEVSLRTIKYIQPGKDALTEYWVEKKFVRHTLLRVRIHTGRTHQIRVHMFASNHPVVGDKLYQNKNLLKAKDKGLTRLFLHATKLCFADLDEKRVCFEAGLPEELKTFLEVIG
jgi:23S rRNA-/tRNA-specific pseudouridylate synthase